jgi:colicin import membrane protein
VKLLNNDWSCYLLSAVLHAAVIAACALAGKGWFLHNSLSEVMVVDMSLVVDEEIAEKPAPAAPNESESEAKENIKGDTKLTAKEEQTFDKPQPSSSTEEKKDLKPAETNEKPPEQPPEPAPEAPKPEAAPPPAEEPAPMEPETVKTEPQPAAPPAPVKRELPVKPVPKPEAAKPLPSPQKRREPSDEHMEKVLKAVKQYKQEVSSAAQHASNGSSKSDEQLGSHLAQYVQNQLIKCWNIPVAASSSDIKIYLRAVFDPLGNVIDVSVTQQQSGGDTLYEAVESSAIRAVRQCSPLIGLPADKYHIWGSMDLVFDSKNA